MIGGVIAKLGLSALGLNPLTWLKAGLAWLGRLAMSVLRWIFADTRHMVIAALATFGAVAAWNWDAAALRAEVNYAAAVLIGERHIALDRQHRKFVFDVAAAQRAADRAARANIARVEAEYRAVIERTEDEYEVRLADTDAALASVQDALALAGAARRSDVASGSAAVPGPYRAECIALGAPDCDTFFATVPGLLAEAERNTAKLIGLQDYVRSTLLIERVPVAVEDAE